MILARRDFLRLLGLAAGGVGLGACNARWEIPDRLVAAALRGPGLESFVETVCGLCEASCGLRVRLVDGLPVGVKGNPSHPLNRGGLCPVGLAALDLLYSPDRLRTPMRRKAAGGHEPASWEDALSEIAGRLRTLASSGRGDGIAVLNSEPGALLHDLVQRFAGLFGSQNVVRLGEPDTLPYALTMGLDRVPGYDLAGADLVISFGLDLFEDGPAPVHAIAALVGDRETRDRAELIHVGSRLSPSATKAKPYVSVRPGTHGAFALGVAHVMVREGLIDRAFVSEHTIGFEDGTDDAGRRRSGFRRLLLERYYPDRVARLTGCDPDLIFRVARRIGEASRPLAVFGGEASRASNATSCAVAVLALNALMGAYYREGGVRLPAPVPFAPMDTVPSSRASARAPLFAPGVEGGVAGADPVAALSEAVVRGTGAVEALFLVGGDPVQDSAAGGMLRQAMEDIPLIVALSSFPNDTTRHADWVLPSSLFLEGWEAYTTPPTVAFSALGLASPVLEPTHDTWRPGDVFLDLGRRAFGQGVPALPWPRYQDYLKSRIQGLAESGQGSIVTGSFEERWAHFLEERGWRFQGLERIEDFWQNLAKRAAWWDPVAPQADRTRLFPTPSGRFEFWSSELERRLRVLGAADAGALPASGDALKRGIELAQPGMEGEEALLPHFDPPRYAGEGEFVLVPFRTSTARGDMGTASAMVLEMFGYFVLTGWRAWVEISPEAARERYLEDGDLVAVESAEGRMEAVLRVRPGAGPGALHAPLGLGGARMEKERGALAGNPGALVPPVRDRLSGALALEAARVRLRLLERGGGASPFPVEKGDHE